MSNTIQVPCQANSMATKKVAIDLLEKRGFVLLSDPEGETLSFEIARAWLVLDTSPLHFAQTLEVQCLDGSLVLTYDGQGVSQRTLVLSGILIVVGVLLIIDNFNSPTPMESVGRVLLPIAPWPFLLPLIHKNMGMMAEQKWKDFLRLINRSAAVEETSLEMPDEEPSTNLMDEEEEETVEI
jgi:hypothetical protein